MLANLLPGIRELRTPLATGFIWLLTFWLWIPEHFKDTAPTVGVPADIVRLAHYSGRIGVGIAVSFIAYLVGVLTAPLFSGLLRRIGSLVFYYGGFGADVRADDEEQVSIRFRDFFSMFVPYPHLDDPKGWAKVTIVDARYLPTGIYKLKVAAQREGPVIIHSERRREINAYLAYLIRYVFSQGNALIGAQPDLFAAYDRLNAEYEFRIGVAAPLTALIVTLAVRWTPLWLIALLPLFLLLRTGSHQLMEAGDVLADAHLRGLLPVVAPPGLAGRNQDGEGRVPDAAQSKDL